MTHQTTESRLDCALRELEQERERERERIGKETARAHLSRLLRLSEPFISASNTWIAAHDYLYPPVVKELHANDDHGWFLK